MVITCLCEYPTKRLIFDFHARHQNECETAWQVICDAGMGGAENNAYHPNYGCVMDATRKHFDRRWYLGEAKKVLDELGDADIVYSPPTDDHSGFDGFRKTFRFKGAEPRGYVCICGIRRLDWSVPRHTIQLNDDGPDPDTPMRVSQAKAKVLPI